MSGHECEHIEKAEYVGITKEMAEARERHEARSERQQQVERAFGQEMPTLLESLHAKHEGNVSAMLREVSGHDEVAGSISRPTLYNWLERYEVREQ